ncbi:TIGR03545 family protein [Glaciecola sp. MH2013]|uniref:TIGR03545 family protein n=1 Tax=Glaciecola sp. MH2013 TaxID=2785524 RepID=UPI0018A0BAC5|nr:TIGR03545 family protein [Glaciecola sp. MH2013]MBF7071854.1 TIGR03545 family protein [Glaciecola sp. MH2013]
MIKSSQAVPYSNQQGKVKTWLALPLGIVALLFVLYFLFANVLLKSLAQSALGNASGAEVNIDTVDHSLFPFGLTLNRIQATDNAQPSRNKVEITQVKADVDLLPLLNSKLIVEELIVQDLAFNTTRENPGEVYVQPDQQASPFAFPTLEDLPSVDEVLASSPLQTTAAVAQAKEVVDKYQKPLKEQYDSLPTKEQLQAYKDRLKALKETDYKNPAKLAGAKKEFDSIKEAMKADRDKISAFMTLAKEAKAASADSIAALKAAPQEDYALLQGLVAGDEGAIGQVTQHLFGDKAKIYTQGILAAIDMLANAEASPDEPVEQQADDGLPKVWIKKAAVNVKWQDESIESVWENITNQHDLIGKATEFVVNSSKANNWENIDFSGNFSIAQGKVNAVQNWDIQGLVLEAVELVPEESKQKLNALLESGLLASKGGLNIQDGKLSGSSLFDLSALSLKANGQNDLTSTMAEIISGLSELNLMTDFAGSLNSPKVSVSSDLDKKMLASLTQGLSGANSGKLAELKSKLNDKIATQLGDSNAQLESVDALLSAAQGDTDSLNELLKSQMTNALEDKKDELLNKLGGKLFGKD